LQYLRDGGVVWGRVRETTLLPSFGGLGDVNQASWHTSSMPTLRPLCCRWACHVIHVNVGLAVLSLGLPRHPCRCCPRRVGCHWACHFILGVSASTLGLLDYRWALSRSRPGEGKGVSCSGERRCKHHVPPGSPTTWVSPCISIPLCTRR